jgi:hypothetical protein
MHRRFGICQFAVRNRGSTRAIRHTHGAPPGDAGAPLFAAGEALKFHPRDDQNPEAERHNGQGRPHLGARIGGR